MIHNSIHNFSQLAFNEFRDWLNSLSKDELIHALALLSYCVFSRKYNNTFLRSMASYYRTSKTDEQLLAIIKTVNEEPFQIKDIYQYMAYDRNSDPDELINNQQSYPWVQGTLNVWTPRKL